MSSDTNVRQKDEIKTITNKTIFEKTAIKESEDDNKDYTVDGFFIKEGIYQTFEMIKGKPVLTKLSNFTMKSMFHLINGTNNTLRIIYIQGKTGKQHFVDVYSNEMKPESFETILKSKQCTFLGSSYQLKLVFAKMMAEEVEATILHYLGWNVEQKLYVFADSVCTAEDKILYVDELGIIEINKDVQYYLPAFGFSNINNEDYRSERLYKFEPGKADFKTWASLFFDVFGDNGLIGLLYTILAIYRDVVFNQIGFFPFLFLFGAAGTGKTSFTFNLLSLFGRDTIGTSLNNATIVALSRLVSSRCNSIFYFKEYTTKTDEQAEDFILTAYDGAGRTTGIKTNDNRTRSHPVRSAVTFDGNALPSQNAAILTRMVLLNFQNSIFTSEQTKAFKTLKELTGFGLGNVLKEILKLRPIIESGFRDKYKEVSVKIKDKALNLPERNINHTALLYSIFELLQNDLTFPFTPEIAEKVIVENAENLNNLLKESSEISVFWQSFSYNLKKSNVVKFEQSNGISNKGIAIFRLKYEGADSIILQIKLSVFYPLYVRYCKDNNVRFLDSNSIRMILTSNSNTSFIPSHQKGRSNAYTDKEFGSCYQFKATKTDFGIEINEVEINL